MQWAWSVATKALQRCKAISLIFGLRTIYSFEFFSFFLLCTRTEWMMRARVKWCWKRTLAAKNAKYCRRRHSVSTRPCMSRFSYFFLRRFLFPFFRFLSIGSHFHIALNFFFLSSLMFGGECLLYDNVFVRVPVPVHCAVSPVISSNVNRNACVVPTCRVSIQKYQRTISYGFRSIFFSVRLMCLFDGERIKRRMRFTRMSNKMTPKILDREWKRLLRNRRKPGKKVFGVSSYTCVVLLATPLLLLFWFFNIATPVERRCGEQ